MKRLIRFGVEVALFVPAVIGCYVIIIWPTRYAARNLSLGDEPSPKNKPSNPT